MVALPLPTGVACEEQEKRLRWRRLGVQLRLARTANFWFMEGERSAMSPQDLEKGLDKLFEAYREACPDAEPGAAFAPGLWKMIDARRSQAYSLQRWARTLVTAAAAICLVLGILTSVVSRTRVEVSRFTYVEVLAAENLSEGYPYFEAVSTEPGGPTQR